MGRPPSVVDTRLLSAEACASASLALIQQPVFWEALTTLALITETIEARRGEGLYNVGEAVCQIIDEIAMTEREAEQAVQLLGTVDSTARTWAAIAHLIPPGRPPAKVTILDHVR